MYEDIQENPDVPLGYHDDIYWQNIFNSTDYVSPVLKPISDKLNF
ncbi:MAG: hypothetical protein PHX18_07215 [Candidatus Gastranaerophilales bacterium]|nr:hypothetical protein [Candidatus Gastranaerophilales bacterium]